MKTKYIIPLVALAIGFVSCDDWYTEHQLNHPNAEITNVQSIDYVLTDADYKAIAENEQNKQIALDIDQDGGVYDLLLSVRDLKYFPEGVDADLYIPAWLQNKYPHLSTQSFLNVTYRAETELPQYLSDFANMSEVTLSDVFTPATISQLTSKLADGTEGEVRIVNYKYQDIVISEPEQPEKPDTTTKPIIDGPVYSVSEMLAMITALPTGDKTAETYFCKGKISEIKQVSEDYGNARFYICDGTDTLYCYDVFYLDSAKFESADQIAVDDSVIVKGQVQYYNMTTPEFVRGSQIVNHWTSGAWKRAPRHAPQSAIELYSKVYQFKNAAWKEYAQTGVNIVVIPQEVYAQQGSKTLADADRVIPMYLKNTYPYAPADAVYAVAYKAASGLVVDEYVFNGMEWVKTLNVEEQTLAFENKGNYWEANISLYLSEPFSAGQGSFTIQDVMLTDPLTYVWKFDARYGMKATAYVSGNHASESWLVSPTLKFKNAIKPVLSFDQASKYAASFTEELFIMVSTDYAGDVTTATWTHVPFNKDENGEWIVPDGASWDFIPTGNIDLSAFVGNKVTIGFKYTSSDAASATWEIKNVRVEELPE